MVLQSLGGPRNNLGLIEETETLLDAFTCEINESSRQCIREEKESCEVFIFYFFFSLGGDVGSGSKEKVSKRQVTRKRQTDTEEAHSQSKKIFMVRTFKMNM